MGYHSSAKKVGQCVPAQKRKNEGATCPKLTPELLPCVWYTNAQQPTARGWM